MRRCKAADWREFIARASGEISFDIATDDGLHAIRWQVGRLTLVDHDIQAERVFQGLGGGNCPCLLIGETLAGLPKVVDFDGETLADARKSLDAMSADSYFRKLPASEQEDLIRRTQRKLIHGLVPPAMSEVISHADQLRARRRERTQKQEKVAKDAPAPRNLGNIVQETARPLLAKAMQAYFPGLPLNKPLLIECWVEGPGQGSLLVGEITPEHGFVVVSLPASWLNRVWRRGLALIDDRFVLNVDRRPPMTDLNGSFLEWTAIAGGCFVPVARPCRLSRNDGVWKLRYRE